MKKIINGMFHSSTRTKVFLWSMTILIIGGLSLIIISALTSNLWLFITALILGVLALILSQANTLQDVKISNNITNINNKIDLSALENVPENQIYSHIDENLIEQILIAYKVKKDHRMVIIDKSDRFKISQCPAYIWVEHGNLYLLLIEKEPRRISIPLSAIDYITYQANFPVYTDSEYLQFKKESLIKKVFYPFLPDYHGEQKIYKNLYYICKDIAFTNNSISQLMDLVCAEFKVEDALTKRNNTNQYFIECYQNGILLKDTVIPIDVYKSKLTNILESLVKSTISDLEFGNTIKDMLTQRLITEDFAVYYTGLRTKHNQSKK